MSSADMSSVGTEPPVAERAGQRGWRFLISPKWLGWHATMVVAVLGMLGLGYWQLRRAEEGNALSWAYTFEWPIFAIMAVIFWAKTIRDEFVPPDADAAADRAEFAVGGPAAGRAEGADGADGAGRLPSAAGAAQSGADEEDSDLAAYNAYLARLNEQVKGHGRWHGLR
jgi:hypothetical protein